MNNPKIIIRPSIASDIAALTDDPLPFRIRAWTALIGDRVIGIGGIGYMPSGAVVAFLQLSDEARKHKFTLHRAALRFLAQARAQGIEELVTLPDPDIGRAEPWLRRLGFAPVIRNGERIYAWPTR